MIKIKSLKNTAIAFSIASVLFVQPIVGHAELGDEVLEKGMTHEDIKILQEHLIDLGYLKLDEANTYYCESTQKAVLDFQSSQGLKEDGTFNIDTYEALQNVLDQYTPLVYEKPLKFGMTGDDVLKLQERLKTLGYLIIDECTDYYGSMTRQAIMEFQIDYDIEVDGSAGPETIKTINQALFDKDRRLAPSSSRSGLVSRDVGINIANTAKKYVGSPYAYGGNSPKGFDCSGFTCYVYKQYGIDLPRSSSSQAGIGTKVNKGDLQVGDLLIFSNTYKSGPSHSGVYIGNNKFVHASTSKKGVIVSDLNSNYYRKHFSYGRRVF